MDKSLANLQNHNESDPTPRYWCCLRFVIEIRRQIGWNCRTCQIQGLFTSVPAPVYAEKLKDMQQDTLEAHYAFFVNLLPDWSHHNQIASQCRSRIELLAKEIELRRLDKSNSERHVETIDQGTEILLWTKRGAKAAIVAALLAGTALLLNMPLSKLLHAIAFLASPQSSLRTMATVSPSPMPRARIQASQAATTSPTAPAKAPK